MNNIDISKPVQLAALAYEHADTNEESRAAYTQAALIGAEGKNEHAALEFALDSLAASKGVESPEFAAGLAYIKSRQTN